MEAMSIHYPSMCQTLCKGAAVHRRPANWLDTGEKWCMIALANLSLLGCQMALAWGHYNHIRPWFLHSLKVSPSVSILVWPALPVDGQLPWPHSLFQQNNKEPWRGNIALMACSVVAVNSSSTVETTAAKWLRRKADLRLIGKDHLSNSLVFIYNIYLSIYLWSY